jgi:hypothetical protein
MEIYDPDDILLPCNAGNSELFQALDEAYCHIKVLWSTNFSFRSWQAAAARFSQGF